MARPHKLTARVIDAAVRATIDKPEPTAIEVPLDAAPTIKTKRQRSCAAQHFGPWNIWPRWMAQAAEAVRAGTWQASEIVVDEYEDEEYGTYTVANGIAAIQISGQITKHRSSFGGCSSVETRAALRQAERNPEVKSIVLVIDSPGGTVAGTSELAAEVRRVRATKPVYAHVDDLACSAAYWVASQCTRITANEGSMIGCIGTYVVLEDSTGAQEKSGFKYRVVSTGPYKGLGADGAVSDVLVEDVQREVNELNKPFLKAVANGRKTDDATVSTWADGRSHGAAEALSLGLIDAISTLDDAIGFASQLKELPPMATTTNAPAHAGTVAERTALAADDTTAPTDVPASEPKAVDVESPDYKAGYDAGYAAGVAAAKEAVDETPVEPTEPVVEPEAAPADASTSLADLITACEGDKAVAADYTLAGLTAAQARAAYGAVKAARSETSAKAAELARAEFAAGGPKPVATAAPSTPAADESDPKAKAAAEWDADTTVRKGFSSKDNYVAYRSAQLAGRIRVAKSA